MYDPATWEDARIAAEDWGIDLGLYVEYALRKYFKGRRDRERFARWKAERDAADPDLQRIRDFLEDSDGHTEKV